MSVYSIYSILSYALLESFSSVKGFGAVVLRLWV